MNEDMGQRVVAALGEPAARELLEILERSDAGRAALADVFDEDHNGGSAAGWLLLSG